MNLQLDILYEDDYLLVLNKPAGITTNSSDTTIHEQTVQDWTEERLGFTNNDLRFKNSEETDYTSDAYFEQAFIERGGIVHRLDKETSGILLVAKTTKAFKNLQQQFKERTIQKVYLALVHGVLSPANGEVSIPVDRLPWNRKRFGVVPGGRASTTFYQVKKVYAAKSSMSEKFSLVELTPKTGRTHQIRVHMQYLGHPIMSDFLYAGRKTARNDRKLLDRVFLHAAKISFIHPENGQQMSFESNMPGGLQSFIDKYLVSDTNLGGEKYHGEQ